MFGVLQALLFHRPPFGFRSFEQDGLPLSGVDISGREIFQALVITLMVVVTDEGHDLIFQITRHEVVL